MTARAAPAIWPYPHRTMAEVMADEARFPHIPQGNKAGSDCRYTSQVLRKLADMQPESVTLRGVS